MVNHSLIRGDVYNQHIGCDERVELLWDYFERSIAGLRIAMQRA